MKPWLLALGVGGLLIVLPAILSIDKRPDELAARMRTVAMALEQAATDHGGRYPHSQADLDVLAKTVGSGLLATGPDQLIFCATATDALALVDKPLGTLLYAYDDRHNLYRLAAVGLRRERRYLQPM